MGDNSTKENVTFFFFSPFIYLSSVVTFEKLHDNTSFPGHSGLLPIPKRCHAVQGTWVLAQTPPICLWETPRLYLAAGQDWILLSSPISSTSISQ